MTTELKPPETDREAKPGRGVVAVSSGAAQIAGRSAAARAATAAPGQKAAESIGNILLITIVSLIILIVAVGTWLVEPEKVSKDEQRTIASFPSKLRLKHLNEFRDEFEAFFNDHMLGRNELVKRRALMKYRAFGSSTTSKVVSGRDGWLYLVAGPCGPDVRHETRISTSNLDAWTKVLRYRQEWFAKRGIHYLFFVAPNKDSIYPEYLPDSYKPIQTASKLDEMTERLSKELGVPFVNPKSALLNAKALSPEPLYRKTDTHWNDIGAYYAYNSLLPLMRQWYPSLQPAAVASFQRTVQLDGSGDLQRMMGLSECFKVPVPVWRFSGQQPHKPLPAKVVLIHDSFGPGLKQFFEHDFAGVQYHHLSEVDFDLEQIAAEHPDVVVQEVVERNVVEVFPSIADWRSWVAETIKRVQGTAHQTWLDIVPNTLEVNVHAFNAFKQPSGSQIHPVTCRLYTDDGDKVAFDPQTALYHEWYLLKSGNQGEAFLPDGSKLAYGKLIDFVEKSGKFERVSKSTMADGSVLSLYRRL